MFADKTQDLPFGEISKHYKFSTFLPGPSWQNWKVAFFNYLHYLKVKLGLLKPKMGVNFNFENTVLPLLSGPLGSDILKMGSDNPKLRIIEFPQIKEKT